MGKEHLSLKCDLSGQLWAFQLGVELGTSRIPSQEQGEGEGKGAGGSHVPSIALLGVDEKIQLKRGNIPRAGPEIGNTRSQGGP